MPLPSQNSYGSLVCEAQDSECLALLYYCSYSVTYYWYAVPLEFLAYESGHPGTGPLCAVPALPCLGSVQNS